MALQCSVFILILISAYLDFDFLFKLSFLVFVIIFIWTWYYLKVFVINSNKKALNRVRKKQSIFTESLTDDEFEDFNNNDK